MPEMALIPLRRSAQQAVTRRWRESCHPGLAMARFAPSWVPNGGKMEGAQRRDFFLDIGRLVDGLKGGKDKQLWSQFCVRRAALFGSLDKQGWHLVAPLTLKTQWRMVSGLGIAHPYETGFVFDHTYGVPFLPGSSVKGAARAWAKEMEREGQKQGWNNTEIDLIFGSETTPDSGHVVFFDAYPIGWPQIDIDIINPHYGPYYSDGKTPPADWHSPIPNYFLTVKRGQAFEFRVAAKPQASIKLAERAIEAVKGAAMETGLGGKTAVGYGYFEE